MKRYKWLAISLVCACALCATGLMLLSSATGAAGDTYAQAGSSAVMSLSVASAQELPAAEATQATMPVVIASADFTAMYSSVTQLKQTAELIVEGEVVDVSYLDFNTSAYTEVTLMVAKCLKGDVSAGDKIAIAEIGGITTMKTIVGDKFGPMSEADAATKVKVQLDGAPLTRVGDECTYFLTKGVLGILPGTYYSPVGAFQGRFVAENGVAKRFVPADWENPKYTELATTPSDLDKAILSGGAGATE